VPVTRTDLSGGCKKGEMPVMSGTGLLRQRLAWAGKKKINCHSGSFAGAAAI